MAEFNNKYFGRILPIMEPPHRDRYTKRDWNCNNDLRLRTVEEQQKIAEKILSESNRIREQTEERTKINKETTDRRFTERIEDVKFLTSELVLQRNEICIELEALEIYRTRLINNLQSLQENSLKHCYKCLQIREHREGIDLTVDEVEIALQKEMMIILNWQSRLQSAIEQIEETMRRLRAVRYSLDEDLEQKEHCMSIEREVVDLKPTNLSLALCKTNRTNDVANVSKAEWEIYTKKNLDSATREIFHSRPVRIAADLILKEASEDLRSTFSESNQALKNRIAETKKIKTKLEELLAETVIKIEAMTNNINCLEKSLDDKLPYLALAHTRIEKRMQRPGIELVKDAVCHSLNTEFEMLKVSTEQLQNAIAETHTSLRYLKQVKINLEEDLRVKMRSLEIDECDCLTIRTAMNQYQY